jgi:hypothetical protein
VFPKSEFIQGASRGTCLETGVTTSDHFPDEAGRPVAGSTSCPRIRCLDRRWSALFNDFRRVRLTHTGFRQLSDVSIHSLLRSTATPPLLHGYPHHRTSGPGQLR